MPTDDRTSPEPCAAVPQPAPPGAGDDAEFEELVGIFVESAGRWRDELSHRLASGDVDGLRVKAHQLKGAAGGYGFPALTAAAAGLEAACEPRDEAAIVRELARVLDCLERMAE